MTVSCSILFIFPEEAVSSRGKGEGLVGYSQDLMCFKQGNKSPHTIIYKGIWNSSHKTHYIN